MSIITLRTWNKLFFESLPAPHYEDTTKEGKEDLMDTTHSNDHKLLTSQEAADLLGIVRSTLYQWTYNKRYNLPVVKIGKYCRYRLSDLLEFIEKRTVNKPTHDRLYLRENYCLGEVSLVAFCRAVINSQDLMPEDSFNFYLHDSALYLLNKIEEERKIND